MVNKGRQGQSAPLGHHCESVQGGDMEERGRKVYVLGREADLKDVRVVRNRLTCMGGLLVQSKEMSGPRPTAKKQVLVKGPRSSMGACVDVCDSSCHAEACSLATSWGHVSRTMLPWKLC